ncbi:VOC family protein [Streptomyces ficellus]|uniref:VOC family protein n=1 Tax=Streptomyces ficellus TaxID=1977088 RepID=A0A6I6FJW7_9ACTN|nr:VOC family protein [Streptomyces ficellus]QGV79495.1 VOC family protein [Streptomyces ficellus]
MAVQPEGMPCWADAMFGDLDGAKRFYGEVLGWTFGESATEFGNYTEASHDGKAVAAIVPPMPGAEGQSAWCLYLASPDAAATAQKIRDNGGEILMEPMRVADFGTMVLARDPGGVVFGVWQAGTHEGFQSMGATGAYCWAEVYTREPQKSDDFFPAVFPYRTQTMHHPDMDFRVYNLGDQPALGRLEMDESFPAEIPPHINVYFAVPDCDAAVAKATDLGGVLRFGPMSSPFGRFAVLTDPAGAVFSVIDLTTTEGDMPTMTDA